MNEWKSRDSQYQISSYHFIGVQLTSYHINGNQIKNSDELIQFTKFTFKILTWKWIFELIKM